MKKIVPFKKDIIFKTNLSEIVSISLEHSLHLEKDSLITGEFIISGEYKMTDTSVMASALKPKIYIAHIRAGHKAIMTSIIIILVESSCRICGEEETFKKSIILPLNYIITFSV